MSITPEFLVSSGFSYGAQTLRFNQAQWNSYSTWMSLVRSVNNHSCNLSARITEFLIEQSFTFSSLEYIDIHRRLCEGIYEQAIG